ncbi:unnamed protein product [Arabis nemorensis]|uniref:PUM-HD domain-containing protein n=1 Tax=Arabis nemorensis TaxID=586526 RepID=A0A565BK17_9BRAS|nr:unnamed protein product [Arabis nemorensis]
MDAFRVNTTNGERDGWTTPVNQPAATTTAVSPSQSQMQSSSSQVRQPETQRADEQLFGVPSEYSLGVDLQTLESSFGRLSVFDSTARQQYPRQSNRSSNQMLNNGVFNGNLRDVPYFSRNRFADQSPRGYGAVAGINNPWMSGQNHALPPALENGRGSVVSLAKDRVSCLQLQKMIHEGSRETIDKIFKDVIFHICDLMVDPFGQHVIQMLIEKCSSKQITRILDVITHHHFQFVRICIDPLGTRTIQTLLNCLQSEDQILRIVEPISRVALTLTRSNNGKHVVLQCLNQFTPSQTRNLQDVIVGHCSQIATDQHGCCMLQHCLGINFDQLKHRLIAEIIAHALKLCVDCYGNYVVQYVVELEDHNVTAELVRQLVGHYGYLSRNKYGSHAVQKLLKINYIDSGLIVHDLLREIDTLLLDPFGNYVIQTAWFVSKDDLRHVMWRCIQNNIPLMSCNKFGRKVLEKLNLQSQR